MKKLFFAVCLLLVPSAVFAVCSWSGNTGTVASPYAAADVQDCINDSAGMTGDVTIQIPTSSPTWTSGITVNMGSGWTNVSGLTVKGQNACTVDKNDRPTSCSTSITNFTVTYIGKEGKAFRISNMKISGNCVIDISGTCKSWRIDHIYFYVLTSQRPIMISQGQTGTDVTYGVLDSLNIYSTNDVVFLNYMSLDNYSWMRPLDLGGPDAIYLENSTYYSTINCSGGPCGVTDANGPGRFVIRYNDFTDMYIYAHDAIVTNHRGVRKWEVYNNTFTYPGVNGACFVAQFRSGTGVMFNNTISDPGLKLCPQYVQLYVYRSTTEGGTPWVPLCSSTSGKAWLDTTSHYPETCTSGTGCINIDGSGPDGYPCRDQAGVDGNNPQVSRPFLFWNNTLNGANASAIPSIGGIATYIVENRDFCRHATTMPSTCNGVTTTYSPLTYPHPLTKPLKYPYFPNILNIK